MTQGLCKNPCHNKKKTGLILKQSHSLTYSYKVIYFQLFTSRSSHIFVFNNAHVVFIILPFHFKEFVKIAVLT